MHSMIDIRIMTGFTHQVSGTNLGERSVPYQPASNIGRVYSRYPIDMARMAIKHNNAE